MKKIYGYKDYIVELKILEALRTFPLFLSKRLRDVLSEIDHEIAKELLNMHSDLDTRTKQTFLDVHPTKNDSVTFVQPNKAAQLLGVEITSEEELTTMLNSPEFKEKLKSVDDDSDVYTKFRGEIRWGRIVNSIFNGKYPNDIPGGQNSRDVTSFVSMYKSLYNQDERFALMEIVRGDDIAYWYNHDRYAVQDMGTLGSSCMQSVSSSYFDIYVDNPDKVGLLVMYEDDSKSKIRARAIVWTLSTPEDATFMDRVYTIDSSDEQVYLDYAKEKGWYHKRRQGMGSGIPIVSPNNGQASNIQLIAQLEPVDHRRYPYLDTMTFYNPDSGLISNQTRGINAKYELTETDGSYYTVDSYEPEPEYVYSNYHGQDIDKREAKYCKFGDDWVYSEEAIRVWNSGPDGPHFAVPGYPDIVHSSFDNYDKWFPKSKAVWSEFLDTWLFKWSAVRVWTDMQRKGSVLLHKKHHKDKKFKEVNGEYWFIDLFDENGELLGIPGELPTRPVGEAPRGWHRRNEFIDEEGNIFHLGKYIGKVE